MTILFDADDVAENLGECWVAALNERYGTSVSVEDLKNWDTTLAFPTLTREQVYGIIDEPGFWKRITPMPGALDGLQRLRDNGHELYMVSASDVASLPEKFERLCELFPFLDWQHVIITGNKQMIRGDVLIDDGPHNLIGGDYVRLLYDRPHNRSFDEKAHGITRCRSWDEIVREIEKL